MNYQDGIITDFEPGYRDLDRDRERYMFAIVDLAEAGAIERKDGEPLLPYCEKGLDWIEDRYFERRLYDAIERYHTPTGEIFYGWPAEGTQAAIDRLVALGEAARAKRIWRAHLALLKKTYWFYADEKRRGFRPARYWAASEAEQRAAYEMLVAQLPERKCLLLDILAGYATFLDAVGANAAERDRLARDAADIAAEFRTPPGKPDPRPMDAALFWEIVETAPGETAAERLEALPEAIARFKPVAIRAFGKLARERFDAAYRTDVWALAYLLRGGCSDDAFMGFRGWLILAGRAVYEAALADPDGFDPACYPGESDGCETVLEAAEIAHELRAGKPLPPSRTKPVALAGPEIDEADFPRALPRLAAALGWRR